VANLVIDQKRKSNRINILYFTQGWALQISQKMIIAATIIRATNSPVQAIAQVFFSPKRSI